MPILFTILFIVLIILTISLLILFLNQKSVNNQNINQLFSLINNLNQSNLSQQEHSKNLNQNNHQNFLKLLEYINKIQESLNLSNNQLNRGLNQINDINLIMTNKKKRGNYGEYQLENLFLDFFGNNYKYFSQYKFNDNKIVDYAIIVKDKIIAIDAKFPLENYLRYLEDASYLTNLEKDIKKHVDDVASKYIDDIQSHYVLIFIPSLAIYELIFESMSNLVTYAQNKKVFFCSFNNILALIQSIIVIYNDLDNRKNITETLKLINSLKSTISTCVERFEDMNKSLQTVENKKNKLAISLNKLERAWDKLDHDQKD